MEFLKHLSDKWIIWFFKITSGFGKELTRDGREEQQFWRAQRLRNLQGLAHMSKKRYAKKSEAG